MVFLKFGVAVTPANALGPIPGRRVKKRKLYIFSELVIICESKERDKKHSGHDVSSWCSKYTTKVGKSRKVLLEHESLL